MLDPILGHRQSTSAMECRHKIIAGATVDTMAEAATACSEDIIQARGAPWTL